MWVKKSRKKYVSKDTQKYQGAIFLDFLQMHLFGYNCIQIYTLDKIQLDAEEREYSYCFQAHSHKVIIFRKFWGSKRPER